MAGETQAAASRTLFLTLIIIVLGCAAWVVRMERMLTQRSIDIAVHGLEPAATHAVLAMAPPRTTQASHAEGGRGRRGRRQDDGAEGHGHRRQHHGGHHQQPIDHKHHGAAKNPVTGLPKGHANAVKTEHDSIGAKHDSGGGGAAKHDGKPQRHHHLHHHRGPDGSKAAAALKALGGKVAFAVVVSNEDFVDGALTLAWSFRNHSALFRDGSANLVLVAPRGALCDESLARLRAVGWADQRLVDDLTKKAGNSAWAGTFNKLYLFNLTEYKRVAYFDVDMLMLRSPDDIFASHLPDDTYIGALGNSHHKHKPYFQTGMMLIVPTADAFETMMHDFNTKREHRGVNGRDGIIIRRYYGDRYVNLDDRLSAHLRVDEPLNDVIGFHFRGSWKPWFNKALPPATDPRQGPKAVVEREIGEAYFLWWATYEDLHRRVLQGLPLADGAPDGYSAATSVWMMRHTSKTYQQPLTAGAARPPSRRAEFSPLFDLAVHAVGLVGESCDFVCALRSATCHEPTLRDPRFNNCSMLTSLFDCEECSELASNSAYPGLDARTQRCHANPLAEPTQGPRCSHVDKQRRRACACLPHDSLFSAASVKSRSRSLQPQLEQRKASSKDFGACRALAEDVSKWSADQPCRRYLADLSNVADAVVMPSSAFAGITVKLLLRYRDGSKSIMKLPQRGFPHEPQSEVLAYAVDRSLKLNRVPPTVHAWVAAKWLAEAFKSVIRGATYAHSQDLDPQLQTAEQLVLDFCRDRTDVRKKGSDSDGMMIAVSIQLWIVDVHPLTQTALALPSDYASWLVKNGTAPVAFASTVAQLADLIVFDFIIGNEDRDMARNTFVMGACQGVPRCTAGAAPVKVPQTGVAAERAALIFLDQGHAFYDSAAETRRNPLGLSIASRGDLASVAYCAVSRRLLDALISTLGPSRDRNRDDDDGERTAATSLVALVRHLLESTAVSAEKDVIDVVGEGLVSSMHQRVKSCVQHFTAVSGCAMQT